MKKGLRKNLRTSIERFGLLLSPAPWTLWLTVIVALYLFRAWYFSTGYLTFGDLSVPRSDTVLPQAFQLWNLRDGLGFPDTIYVLVRVFFGVLFELHVREPIVARIVWFYFAPPLLIGGSYLLAATLTGDRVAAGVASLTLLLSPDFLVRSIGGHASALIPISVAPWALLGTVRALREGNQTWLGAVAGALFIGSAYDSRWALPTFVLSLVVGTALCLRDPPGRWRHFCAFVLTALAAMALANLTWLLPLVFTGSGSPSPPGAHFDPAWVQKLSFATAADALAGWNPAFWNDFSGAPFLIRHLPWYGGLFVAAVWLCAFRSKKYIAGPLFACYLGAAFLFKGAQPPFGSVYLWLFQHFPLFHLYREPLKFGSTVSLCAGLLISLGLASLRANRVLHFAGTLSACIIVAGLSFHAFGHIGGTLQSRESPPSYGRLKAFLQQDGAFGRVLWIPQVSRWGTASASHPFAGAVSIGNVEWAPFLRDKPANETGLSFARSPLFFDLLNWNGFRYVVIDQDTEVDATFRAASFPTEQIRSELSRDSRFRRIAAFGPLTVYRINKPFAPPLWSANFAAVAYGIPSAMNAGAMVHAFPRRAPVILQRDLPDDIPVRQRYIFDSATGLEEPPLFRTNDVQRVQRIVGAKSVDYGPQRGDAVIAQRGPSAGRWNVRFAFGKSTLAVDLPLGTLPPAPLRTVPVIPRGEILQRVDFPIVWLQDKGKTYRGEGFSLPAALAIHSEFPALVRCILNVRLSKGAVIVSAAGVRYRIGQPGGNIRLTLRPGETILHLQGGIRAAASVSLSMTESSTGKADMHVRGAYLPIIPTGLGNAPSVEVVAGPSDGVLRHLALVLQLRDASTGKKFVVIGPAFVNGIVPGGKLDVRNWLLQTVVSIPRNSAVFEGNESLERLQLSGAGLYETDRAIATGRRMLHVAINASAAEADGYVVNSALRLPASEFLCVRCKKVLLPDAVIFNIDYHPRSGRPSLWVGNAVAIDASEGAQTGIVTSESAQFIQGITWLGTPFAVRRKAIHLIQDAQDTVVIELSHRVMRPLGILYVSVEASQLNLGFKLLLDVKGGINNGSIVVDPTPAEAVIGQRTHVWKVDLTSLVLGSGNRAISHIRLLVRVPGNDFARFAQLRLSDALIVGGEPQRGVISSITLGEKTLNQGVAEVQPALVRSSLGTRRVPLVAQFSRGRPVAYKALIHDEIPSSRMSLSENTHNRWLILSERFDPGWHLLDADGRNVGAHVRVYGTINGWYVAKGLHGLYTIAYVSEGPGGIGVWLSLSSLFACAALCAAYFLRKKANA